MLRKCASLIRLGIFADSQSSNKDTCDVEIPSLDGHELGQIRARNETSGFRARAEPLVRWQMTSPAHHIVLMGNCMSQELLEALESGKLGGAGLDVHWEEPADPSDPLYQHPNVQATPHTGVCTHDVIDAYAALLADNIVRRREGRELVHRLV